MTREKGNRKEGRKGIREWGRSAKEWKKTGKNRGKTERGKLTTEKIEIGGELTWKIKDDNEGKCENRS